MDQPTDTAAFERLLTRTRRALGDLLTGCVEVEQPFDVDAELAPWREWAERALVAGEAVAFELRMFLVDSDQIQAGGYVVELDALIARLRGALARVSS